MEFTIEIYEKIIGMGAKGYSTARIAHELNITPDRLRDLRAVDEKLNEALNRAEYNFDQLIIGRIEESSVDTNSNIKKDVYLRLIQKHNSGDNEIRIIDV